MLRKIAQVYRQRGATGVFNAIWRKLATLNMIDISDDYINWLSFANSGMLHRGNLYCFDYAIEHLPTEAPIIEIGSFCGLSANVITYY
jgi:hypothetical protein